MAMVIESKSCLIINDKVVCNEKFKAMIESTERALTLDVVNYNREKEDLKRIVKDGLDVANKLGGYKLGGGLRIPDYTRYLQKTGKIPRQHDLTDKARVRLDYLGYRLVEKPRDEFIPQDMWEESKIKKYY